VAEGSRKGKQKTEKGLIPSILLSPVGSRPANRPDVFSRDHQVVEIDGVGGILRPTIGNVRFQRQGIRLQFRVLAPIEAAPVAQKPSVEPASLSPVGVSRGYCAST
jgi:hypothetical protein